MGGALIAFTATAVGVREVARGMALFDLLAIRTLIGLALVAAVARGRLPGLLATRRLGLHVLRNGIHFAAVAAWSLAVTLLPLATAFALEFTSPAWATVLAVLILHERLTPTRLLAMVLGLVGVLVILRPGLATLQAGSLLMLGAAFGFAATTVATKALTRTEDTLAILFWMNLLQLAMNLVAGRLAGGVPNLDLTTLQWLALAMVGVCGFASHWCLTNAYQHGDAIMVVPLDFLRIPLIAAIAWALYGEPLDPLVLVGVAVIVAGILANLVVETRGTA